MAWSRSSNELFSILLSSASSLCALFSNGLLNPGDEMNEGQSLLLVKLLGKCAVPVAWEIAHGVTPSLCSRIQKKLGKAWTDPQYMNQSGHYHLSTEKSLRRFKNSTVLCLLSKLPVMQTHLYSTEKMTPFTLGTVTSLLSPLPPSSVKRWAWWWKPVILMGEFARGSGIGKAKL